MNTDFQTARHNMVEYQIRCCKVLNPDLLDMLETMPREEYVPEEVRSLAYMEGRVPLPCDQEMLSPLQEAGILQNLQLSGDERVLEIGTGTGYLTMLLAMRTHEVVSCEIHKQLADLAVQNLEAHGVTNAGVVHVNAMQADDLLTLPEMKKAFDVIVLGAALKEIPDHIQGLLAKQGQMIAFIGQNSVLSLVHMKRISKTWQKTAIFETLLQDMEGLPEKREFIF
ncbi:MAG: protein-L-isoaspartate O-methyltransferase [Mariprofundus sp.]